MSRLPSNVRKSCLVLAIGLFVMRPVTADAKLGRWQFSMRGCAIAVAGVAVGLATWRYVTEAPPPKSPSGGCGECYAVWEDDRFDRSRFDDDSSLRRQARRVAHYETHERWSKGNTLEPAEEYTDILFHYRNLPDVKRRLARADVLPTMIAIQAHLQKPGGLALFAECLEPILVDEAKKGPFDSDLIQVHWRAIQYRSEARKNRDRARELWNEPLSVWRVAGIDDDLAIGRSVLAALRNQGRLYRVQVSEPDWHVSAMDDPTGRVTSFTQLANVEAARLRAGFAIAEQVKQYLQAHPGVTIGAAIESVFAVGESDLGLWPE